MEANRSNNLFYWSGSLNNMSNAWADSIINVQGLNGGYLTSIGNEWATKIATATWYVGGVSWANGMESVPKITYDYEVGANKTNTTYESKIGLMYINEYYYAAPQNYWTYHGYNDSDTTKDYRAAKDSNWLYTGNSDWTISRRSDKDGRALGVSVYGYISNGDVNTARSIRPAFSLNANIKVIKGIGTETNPYRLS